MDELGNPRMTDTDSLRSELRDVIRSGDFQKRDFANDGLSSDDLAALVEVAGMSDADIDSAYPDPSVTASGKYPIKQ